MVRVYLAAVGGRLRKTLETSADVRAAGAFALLFLCFFIQLPLNNRLPGNTDSLVAIALSNQIVEKIGLFFSGGLQTTAMYPVHNVLAYGENCYGLAFIFIFFKLLTSSDIWGYYLFLSVLFTLNAFAVFRWVGLFVENRALAWCSGVLFSLAGFTLANIDDPNVVFVFFPVMALYFLELWVREGRLESLRAASFLSGMQIWFGFYIFSFQLLLLCIFTAYHWRRLRSGVRLPDCLRLALAYLGPCVPVVCIYLYNNAFEHVFSPFVPESSAMQISMSWHNFRNVIPGNLLYSEARNVYTDLELGGWSRIRKCGFTGFLLPTLALLGAVTSPRKARFYLLMFLAFGALSFGAHLPGFHWVMVAPLGRYFRAPVRSYLFALIALVLFATLGLERILRMRATKEAALWTVLAASIVLIENVPFPLFGYDFKKLIYPPAPYTRFFQNLDKQTVILDLPSTCFWHAADTAEDERAIVWFFSRDVLYMNWQTYHKQMIVGGTNSYVSTTRADLDWDFQRVPERKALLKLKSAGVGYIVFHKNLILEAHEDVFPQLKKSPDLVLKFDDDEIAIFELSVMS